MTEAVYQVKEAPIVDKEEPSLFFSYTRLGIKARAAPDGEDVEVSVDPGTGSTFISRDLLNTLDQTVIKKSGRAQGIAKTSVTKVANTLQRFFLGKIQRSSASTAVAGRTVSP